METESQQKVSTASPGKAPAHWNNVPVWLVVSALVSAQTTGFQSEGFHRNTALSGWTNRPPLEQVPPGLHGTQAGTQGVSATMEIVEGVSSC